MTVAMVLRKRFGRTLDICEKSKSGPASRVWLRRVFKHFQVNTIQPQHLMDF